jgi:hypothetical protein
MSLRTPSRPGYRSSPETAMADAVRIYGKST